MDDRRGPLSFDQAWPLLDEAAAIGDHASIESVIDGMRNGTHSFFSRESSAAITFETGRTLRIALAGGELAELLDIESEIAFYARQRGFERIEIVGRPGWVRVLPGYRMKAAIMEKLV